MIRLRSIVLAMFHIKTVAKLQNEGLPTSTMCVVGFCNKAFCEWCLPLGVANINTYITPALGDIGKYSRSIGAELNLRGLFRRPFEVHWWWGGSWKVGC